MNFTVASASYPVDQTGTNELLSFTITNDTTHCEVTCHNEPATSGQLRVCFGADATASKGAVVKRGDTRILPVAAGTTSLKVFCSGAATRVSVVGYKVTA